MSITRIVSAAVIIFVLAATLWWMPPWATVALAAIVAALAGVELAGIARALGAPVSKLFIAAAAAAFVAAMAAPDFGVAGAGPGALVALLMAATLSTGLITLASTPPGPAVFIGLGALTMAPAYVGLPLGAIASIRATAGPPALVWLVAVIAISDSAQYYVGTLLGRHKLSPVVSPKKTVEGLAGGLVAAPIAGAALASWGLPEVPAAAAAALALVLALFGVGGDLFESLLKRSAGLKDSSTLIPGHGGVLDRIDAYLFAAPVFYLFLRYLA